MMKRETPAAPARDRAPRGASSTDSVRLIALADTFTDILTVIGGHTELMRARLASGDMHAEDVAGIDAAVREAVVAARKLVPRALPAATAGPSLPADSAS
jgi:hypothetical protein